MKSVQEILQSLNLDLSNPEVVQAAQDAISKILSGRTGPGGDSISDRLNDKAKRPGEEEEDQTGPIDLGEFEQEIDPDLIQPPSQQNGGSDVETEIEDDEGVLNKVRQLGNQKKQQQNQNGGGSGGQQQQMPEQDPENDPLKPNEDNPTGNGGGKGKKQPEGDNPGEKPGDEPGEEPGNEPGGEPGDEPGGGPGGEPGDQPVEGPGGKPGDEPGGQQGPKGGAEGTEGPTGGGGQGPTDDPGEDGDPADEPGPGGGKKTKGTGEDPDGEEPGGGPGGGGENEEVDDEGEDVDDDFTSKLTGNNPKNEAQQIQVSRTIKAAQNAQAKAEANGQNAIAQLLENCVDMLENMLDELESDPSGEISENKMNQVIQRTLDAINEVDKHGLVFRDDEDRQQQVNKIKAAMSDAGIQAELSAEEVEQIRADRQAVIHNKKEIEKYASRGRSSFKGFEEFIQSLRKSLALQIEAEKTKAGSWAAINRRHDGTDVVKPGIKNRILPSTRVPVIDFYFDCSASWGDDDLLKGDEALGKIAQLEKDGEIKVNVFYFADNVYEKPEPPRNEGGTGAWNHIIENIVLTKATNVVIMTDNDMQWQCDDPPPRGYKVNGFVWYLWKDGVNAPRLPTLLQGRSGTLQYAFDS